MRRIIIFVLVFISSIGLGYCDLRLMGPFGQDEGLEKYAEDTKRKVYHVSRDNPFETAGYKGQCTWFCYTVTQERMPTGHAKFWLKSFADKTRISNEPKPGDIAVWGESFCGYGHVAKVVKVLGNGYFEVWDCNRDTLQISKWLITDKSKIIGFIRPKPEIYEPDINDIEILTPVGKPRPNPNQWPYSAKKYKYSGSLNASNYCYHDGNNLYFTDLRRVGYYSEDYEKFFYWSKIDDRFDPFNSVAIAGTNKGKIIVLYGNQLYLNSKESDNRYNELHMCSVYYGTSHVLLKSKEWAPRQLFPKIELYEDYAYLMQLDIYPSKSVISKYNLITGKREGPIVEENNGIDMVVFGDRIYNLGASNVVKAYDLDLNRKAAEDIRLNTDGSDARCIAFDKSGNIYTHTNMFLWKYNSKGKLIMKQYTGKYGIFRLYIDNGGRIIGISAPDSIDIYIPQK